MSEEPSLTLPSAEYDRLAELAAIGQEIEDGIAVMNAKYGDHVGAVIQCAAMSIASNCFDINARYMSAVLSKVTRKGVPIGDWIVNAHRRDDDDPFSTDKPVLCGCGRIASNHDCPNNPDGSRICRDCRPEEF